MTIARHRAVAAARLIALLSALLLAGLVPLPLGVAHAEISKESFFEPGMAPVRQPGQYDVTIVYFMDYQCPACRKHTPDVTRALNEDPRVRVIYRDTPIFGPRSDAAARAAIASQFQGRHEAMHLALMQADMPLDEIALKAAAKKAGVDWNRLQRDLKVRGDEIDAQIVRNMELSRVAGIAGTPAFIVGDYLANGVLDYDGLKGTIADARADGGVGQASPAEAGTAKPASQAQSDTAPSGEDTSDREPGLETRSIPDSGEFELAKQAAGRDGRPGDDATANAIVQSPWLWLGASLLLVVMALFARRYIRVRRRNS